MVFVLDTSTFRIIQFTKDFYTGTIENNLLILDTIFLEGYASDVTYNLIGGNKINVFITINSISYYYVYIIYFSFF